LLSLEKAKKEKALLEINTSGTMITAKNFWEASNSNEKLKTTTQITSEP